MDINSVIRNYSAQPITKQILLSLLKEYKRPYDKINEMVKASQLILVKRGVYVSGAAIAENNKSFFLIANHLYGPSYVSLDTALAYWGLIPEAVLETTSVTTQTNKKFNTDIGRFNYLYLPLPYYSFGIKQLEISKTQTSLIANIEKALCDKIITTKGILLRSAKEATTLMLENYRMDSYLLKSMNTVEMATWLENAPKKESLYWIIKAINKL